MEQGIPSKQIQMYEKAVLQARTAGADYFPTSVVDSYPLTPTTQERAPLTAVGRAINDIGLSSFSLNSALRGGSAKVMQILLLLGLAGLLTTAAS